MEDKKKKGKPEGSTAVGEKDVQSQVQPQQPQLVQPTQPTTVRGVRR